MWARVGAALTATLVAGLMGASGASALVATGHSGWLWSNPVPQGEPLADVSFAGGVGYAVGDFGTALRTTDGGATWTNLPTGLYGNLTEVDAVTASTVILGGGCVLRRSDDGGITFIRLPWTASDSSCSQPIAAIDFPTSDTGYVLLAGGTILRTHDGGQSWARTTAPPILPLAIVFSSASMGIIAGDGIYRTTDGGSTWTSVDASAMDVVGLSLDGANAIVAYDTGGPVAFAPRLFVSGDGGQTWAASPARFDYTVLASATQLSCENGTGCLLAGGGSLFWTTNGAAFKYVTPGVLTAVAASFAGPTEAVAVTGEGIPAVSSDGGATFSEAGAGLPPGFSRLRVSTGALATLAGPSGELALTSDGGGAWTVLDTPSSNPIDDADFLTPSAGVALDSTGAVLRTGNGGSSWQTLTARPGASTILALDTAHVLVAGAHGIARSADGGQSFGSVLTGAAIEHLAAAGSALIASGPSHAYASTNSGASWRAIALPPRFLRSEAVKQLSFTSVRSGFLLGTAGRVFATSDGGKHWHELLGLAHGATLALAFTSTRSGWAAEGDRDGTPGEVLRTDDGGRSWRPQRVSALQIQQLQAAGNEGYAVDRTGDVFATGSAGDLGAPSTISLRAARRVSKHGPVAVTGRLVPAPAGASVEIGYRAVSGGRWKHELVAVGPGGAFSLSMRIASTTAFVAQWAGDVTSRGAGSAAVIVKP